MLKKKEYNTFRMIQSERGAVLVVSMLMLVVLTILGIAATNTSILETLISSSHKKRTAAFYAAEAGLEHGKILLADALEEKENVFDDYDFLLDGSTSVGGATLAAATGNNFAGGVPLLQNISFDGGKYTYNVRIWNYEDAQNDTDGSVYLRSVAEGERGEFAGVEILLGAAMVDGGSRITEEKTAVDGGGTGKNYNASDENPVEAYTSEGAVSWQI